MNPVEIKIFLFKNGLSVSAIARALAPEYGGSVESIRKMLTDLFYLGKYNARLARLVEKRYGIKVIRPSRPQTVREALKQAA